MKKDTLKVPMNELTPSVAKLYKEGVPLHKAIAYQGLDQKVVKNKI